MLFSVVLAAFNAIAPVVLLILLAGMLGGLYRTGTDDGEYIAIERQIAQYDYIGLKSSVHFRDYFAGVTDIAKSIVTVDGPGICTGDLFSYDFKNLPRETIYPFAHNDEK